MKKPAANLQTIADAIDAMEGRQRYANLIAFARSDMFFAVGCLIDGLPGQIHREALAALKVELAADTPGNAWDRAWDAKGRTAIYRSLRIDPGEPTAYFATHPFRILNIDDHNWIAGAIGCPSLLRADEDLYGHLDIREVILWNPRTNAVRLLGEASSTNALVMPADRLSPVSRLTIYADGFAFFRAWADSRAILCARANATSKWQAAPAELPDNEMPGALVIGDIEKIQWRDARANVLVAGPGVDPERLKRALYRSANLPRVEATPYLEAVA